MSAPRIYSPLEYAQEELDPPTELELKATLELNSSLELEIVLELSNSTKELEQRPEKALEEELESSSVEAFPVELEEIAESGKFTALELEINRSEIAELELSLRTLLENAAEEIGFSEEFAAEFAELSVPQET